VGVCGWVGGSVGGGGGGARCDVQVNRRDPRPIHNHPGLCVEFLNERVGGHVAHVRRGDCKEQLGLGQRRGRLQCVNNLLEVRSIPARVFLFFLFLFLFSNVFERGREKQSTTDSVPYVMISVCYSDGHEGDV
jgi:hypothetical protein